MKLIKPLSFILFVILLAIGTYLVVIYLPSIRENNHKTDKSDEKKEQDWKIHLEHAHMQSYLKHYEEAEAEYRKLLAIRPNAIDVKIDLAKILYYQKKYSEALDLLQNIPIEQRNPPVILLMANLYLSQNQYDEAENLYREYLQKNSFDQTAMRKLAEVLSWQKKYEESIQLYQHVLAQDPNNVQVRRQYAKVLIWMGKYAEGAEELQQTLTERNEKESEIKSQKPELENNAIKTKSNNTLL